jgi:hypothetical protein
MATKQFGKDLRIYVDGSIVGYTENFTYTFGRNLISNNELESGEWDSYTAWGKNFKGSANHLWLRTDGDTSRGYSYLLRNFVNTDVSLYIEFYAPDASGDDTISGCVFLDSLTANSNDKGSFATYSTSFTGTGAFTIGTVT